MKFKFALVLILLASLASCSSNNIATESSGIEIETTPSLEPTDTTVDTTSSQNIEINKELKNLIDNDIKESKLLSGLKDKSLDLIKNNVIEALSKMLDGSIYYKDAFGIKMKSGAKFQASLNWAAFHYDNNRYVTGSKYTFNLYNRNSRYSGYYITPNHTSDFDSIYIETEFSEAILLQ